MKSQTSVAARRTHVDARSVVIRLRLNGHQGALLLCCFAALLLCCFAALPCSASWLRDMDLVGAGAIIDRSFGIRVSGSDALSSVAGS